jgi:hypothetical protein
MRLTSANFRVFLAFPMAAVGLLPLACAAAAVEAATAKHRGLWGLGRQVRYV